MEQTLKYRIKESNENPKDAVIEKSGHVITFTLNQIEANTLAMEKIVTEIKAKRDYEYARKSNIEIHHPYVMDFTDEQLYTIHMYQEAKSMVKMADDKLAEFEKQKASDEAEVKDIYEQCPELTTPTINAVTEEIKTDESDS